jgi:flagellar motor switch protein FliM
MSESAGLLRFAAEGARVRKAASSLEQSSPLLASALRRALPFLAARGETIALSFARAMPIGDLIAELPRPIHATRLVLNPGGAHAALILDAGAISTILDGVLGGDGRSPPTLDEAGLSAPQIALAARVVDGIVRSFSDVLAKKFDLSLTSIAPTSDDAMAEGAPIACCLEISGGVNTGRVVLLLAKEALLSKAESREHPVHADDPRVAAVLENVELELVAELTRTKMPLGVLTRLKVGDTIRLDVAVGGAVNVRIDGRVLLRGHPTTQAGQIAIRLSPRHEG